MYLQPVLPDDGDLLDMILDLARAFYYSLNSARQRAHRIFQVPYLTRGKSFDAAKRFLSSDRSHRGEFGTYAGESLRF